MTKKTEARDCPECGTPLLVLQGFEEVVISHECARCSWKTPLRELVEGVLTTLWERRPYKHDLGDFFSKEPGPYEEMLQEMEWYAAREIKKHGETLITEAAGVMQGEE